MKDAKNCYLNVNSIQLYHDRKRWWILSVFWQAEDKELLIPLTKISKTDNVQALKEFDL